MRHGLSAAAVRLSHLTARATLLAWVSSLALAGVAQAAGDAGESAEAAQVTEVIVTAQKREERIDEVPISVTAASGAELAERGVAHPADLERIVPGFIFTASAYDAPIFNLRGVGYFSEALGAPPAVTVYVDQIPVPYSAMTEGSGLDPERVEVLKGPQGTLFGQNSTGGAINYIPARPTATFTAGSDLTYGRFDEVDWGGFLSGPIASDLKARLAFRTEQRGDWQENSGLAPGAPGRRGNGARDFNAGRLLLDWQPNARLAVIFKLNAWSDRSDTQAKQKIGYSPLTPLALGGYPDSPGLPNLQANLAGFPNAGKDARTAGFDPTASLRRDDRFYQASLRADLDLDGGMTLTSISAYGRLDVDRPNDVDGTIYPDIFISVVGDITAFSQELRLSGKSLDRDRLKWLVGAEVEANTVNDTQQIDMNGTNSGFGAVRFQRLANIDDQKVRSAAIFASLDYNLTNRLMVQGSLRYTQRSDDFRGCLADPGGPGGIRDGFAALSAALSGSPTVIAPGACVTLGPDNKPVSIVTNDLDEHNLSWRGGLSWKVTPDVMAYANVTKGYKAGAFDTLPAIRPAQIEPVRQESVLAYEAGLKAGLFDHSLELTAAVFHYDYKDKQIAGYVDTGAPFGLLPALVSVPNSKVDGAELDGIWRPISGLTVTVGASYLETAVRGAFMTATPLGGTANIEGDAFPDAPKWQLVSDAQYEHPLTARLIGFVGGGVTYRSRTVAAFAGGPLFEIPGYPLLDLRAGVQTLDGRWRVEVWGHNVTDRFYWTSVEHTEDTVTRLAGMPATYGVTLRAAF